MNNDSKVFTVAEVAALAPDSWVNGSVAAHVLRVESVAKKAGGVFYKLHLSDGAPDALATMSMFTVPRCKDGDTIRLSGSGIKRGDYNGKCQISTGKETKIEVSPGVAQVASAVHAAVAEQANGKLVPGITVGGAIKAVFSARTQGMTAEQVAVAFQTPGFWRSVHEGASDFIRVEQMLERGELADIVKVRAAHQPQQQQAVAQRPPASTVAEELGEEEPVPF